MTEADVPAERVTPNPTVLSTVWEGPTDDDGAAVAAADQQGGDSAADAARSRPHQWLFEPATRRRAFIVTFVAAVVCGWVFVIDEFDGPSPAPSGVVAQDPAESTQGSLRSRAVATDRPADADTVVREAVSADGRLRITAEAVRTEAGGWRVEAQPVDDAGQVPTVRFTVNGIVVAEVDRAPYRLVVNPEILASLPNPVGEAQPLIVTASAVWPVAGEAASPATLVLQN